MKKTIFDIIFSRKRKQKEAERKEKEKEVMAWLEVWAN